MTYNRGEDGIYGFLLSGRDVVLYESQRLYRLGAVISGLLQITQPDTRPGPALASQRCTDPEESRERGKAVSGRTRRLACPRAGFRKETRRRRKRNSLESNPSKR